MIVKANDFATSGSTQFSIKSGRAIKGPIWRATNLQNKNTHRKFRKMKHIEFDSSMDLDNANEWIHYVQRILEFMELKDKDKVLECVRLIEVRWPLQRKVIRDWMVVPPIM